MRGIQKARKILSLFLVICISLLTFSSCGSSTPHEIINVSYDPTRELYRDYNDLFRDYYYKKTGIKVNIVQSHGGSGKQALEVSNGLKADVVTLALEADVNAVRDAGLIKGSYLKKFPKSSAPYTSTIVFLVRSGNPKKILDWNDLLRDDVGVITPNPKTSGGARWNYLAAWYYFEKQGQSESKILQSMKMLYRNVLVLDSGARGSTTSFVENGQGDVLVAWENEAFLTLEQHPGEYELVIPSVSVLCQPTVAVVDEVVKEHGTEQLAKEYLNYLYSEKAQKLEAEHFFRPTDPNVSEAFATKSASRVWKSIPADGKWIVSDIELTNIDHFGGWDVTTEKHFRDNGLFDQIYSK